MVNNEKLNQNIKLLIGEYVIQVMALQMELAELNALRPTETSETKSTIARKRTRLEPSIDPCADTDARSGDGVAPRR